MSRALQNKAVLPRPSYVVTLVRTPEAVGEDEDVVKRVGVRSHRFSICSLSAIPTRCMPTSFVVRTLCALTDGDLITVLLIKHPRTYLRNGLSFISP